MNEPSLESTKTNVSVSVTNNSTIKETPAPQSNLVGSESVTNVASVKPENTSESALNATATNNIAPAIDETITDVLEERLIDAEYKIWKKNTPYLYDVVMTHSLEWPSLTCQWLPFRKQPEGQPTEEHSLLLGTHTTGEQNYLMVASVILPRSEDNVVVPESATTKSTIGVSKADDNGTMETSKSGTNNSVIAATPVAQYDDERNEVGGFGFTPISTTDTNNNSTSNNLYNTPGKIEIRMKVKHLGEVNRARYMPQNHFIVATRGPDPELYIFDLSKHSSFPDEDSAVLSAPQCVCVGHEKEGYGLAWSPLQEGLLVSGSEDCTVNLWDVNSVMNGSGCGVNVGNEGSHKTDLSNQVKPKFTFLGHTDVVEDVAWHEKDPQMCGSVGDDRAIMLWDIRKPKPLHTIFNAHEGDINSIAFNPINEFLFATGSADKTVNLWDMRNMKT